MAKNTVDHPFPLFDLNEVCCRYNNRFPAIFDFNLRIEKGDRIAILGAMRSGKSSLLKILQGKLLPDRGTILFRGRALDSENLALLQSQVGFAGQFPDEQLFRPTVLDDLVYGSGLMDLVSKIQMNRIVEVCKVLGIQDVFDRTSGELSGSEKKLVSIASSLAFGPEILILDEPTAGLNPYSKEQVGWLLRDSSYSPATLIVSTNDLDIARMLCSRTVLLSPDHRKMADGPTSQILENGNLLIEARMIHEHLHYHQGTPHFHQHAHDPSHEHRHGSENEAGNEEIKMNHVEK